MRNTTYYNLKKPEGADLIDMLHFNENADIIDEELNKRAGKEVATQSTNGLMSAADKKKLDGIDEDKIITYIKGNGTTKSIITQDTVYDIFGGATASAAGKNGLVPGPAAGEQEKFLRGDGIWQTPADTNTWRGIQNNLTSESALDSLAAAQGKILSDKISSINTDLAEKQTQIDNLNIMIGRIIGGVGNFGTGTLEYGATASTALTFHSNINNVVVTPMTGAPMDIPMSVSWSGKVLTIYVTNNHALKYTFSKNNIMYSVIAILTD